MKSNIAVWITIRCLSSARARIDDKELSEMLLEPVRFVTTGFVRGRFFLKAIMIVTSRVAW